MKRLAMMAAGMMLLPMAASAQYLYQEHYRWRNDDGSEASATWKADADTPITGVTRWTNIRLRFSEVNKYTGSYAFPVTAQLQYATSTNGPWTPVSVASDGCFPFEMTTTAGYADGDSTTAQLTGAGTFVAGKCVESPNNIGALAYINLGQYSNFEHCFRATAKATGSTTYYFRLAGFSYQSYTCYAQLTMAAGEANEAPVIKSALTATGSVAFSYTIIASGSEPIAYGASGLPAGLSLNTNRITGTPSSVGTYNVGLTAANAWGSDAKTLALTVLANQPPVASNQAASVNQGAEILVQLRWSDPDSTVLTNHTFTIVSGSSHGGIIQAYNQRYSTTAYPHYYYYKADATFVGQDTFTWKCNDGKDDSNIAIVTITVNGIVPVPSDQTVVVATNTATVFPASYTGGGGYTSVVVIAGWPRHGSVTITNGTSFRYVPTAGYLGPDSFTWNMMYGVNSPTGTTATVTCSLWVKEGGTDWPTFRADAFRSGTTVNQLPASLQLQWRRDLPEARQAWPGASTNQVWPGAQTSGGYFNTAGVYMSIDRNYEPIAADGKVFMGSNRDDCLLAWDAATGVELWRAYTDGPIRLAPVYSNGKVYAGCDDSFIYCWNANTGALLWKKQAVSGGGGTKQARRKVFGNMRLISQWPVRGGLMLVDNKLYFGSGLWPVEGVFVGALDPETGGTLWLYEDVWMHTFNTKFLSPQGYLVRQSTGGASAFYVPCGKTAPVSLPLYSGSLAMGGDSSGGLAMQTASRLAYEWAGLAGSAPLDPGVIPLEGYLRGGGWVIYCDNTQSVPQDAWPVAITAGAKTYSASDVTALGVVGAVWRIIAANGRLFVLTKGSPSSLYCFGGDVQSSPATWPLVVTPLASSNDVWKTRATRILSESGVNDKGVALVLGIGSGRLVDELLLQSSLHVIAVDPDTNKVQALRLKLSNAGLHGVRASVLAGNPTDFGLPPYLARLIVSEDVAAAGWTNGVDFVRGVFKSVRPYDGKAWLFTTSGQHTSFSGWVAGACLTNSLLARDTGNEFSVLTRVGALSGAMEWTAANGEIPHGDRAIKGSLGILWYGDTTADYAGGGHWQNLAPDVAYGRVVASSGRSVDAYSGMVLSGTQTYSGATKDVGLDVRPGIIEESPILQRRSPLFGLRERGFPTTGASGGCCGGGNMNASYGTTRSPGSIYKHDMGVIDSPFKARCGADGVITANGLVVVAQEEGCNCGMPLQTALAFVPDPDVENWVTYVNQRLGQIVEEVPIMRLGVNFGAPAEIMGADGKLWMCEKGVYATPYEPGTAQRYYHHSLRMLSAEGPKWVAASGLQGATKIRAPVAWPAVAFRAAGAPAVDGSLADACWDGASPTLLNRAGTSSGNTWFRYDGTNLYIGALVNNPGGNGIYDEGRRGWTVYLSDRGQVCAGGAWKNIKLDIDYSGLVKTGSKWVLNSLGADDYITTSLTGSWSGAMVWSGTNICTVEFAIPWTTLAAEGLNRDQLLINMIGPLGACIRPDPGYFTGTVTGFYVPLRFDAVPGLLRSARPYKVRLHFAETEGALAGERVFDVKLQGNKVLSDFDVFTAAGGADRGIVREFTGIQVGNELVVELVPKAGLPVISGVELDAQFTLPNQAPVPMPTLPRVCTIAADDYSRFSLSSETIEPEGDAMSHTWALDGVQFTNGVGAGAPSKGIYPWNLTQWTYYPKQADVGEHRVKVTADDGRGGATSFEWTALVTGSNSLPVAACTASPTVGTPGMTVNFDASGSVDTNGSIVGYAWDYADGTTGSGVTANHVFTQAGSYSVRLTVTDNGGAKRSTTVMIYAISQPGETAPAITSALTATGTVGQAFSYTIAASGTTPIMYGASGLPAGLNRSGAVISGTPTTAGTNNVTLSAVNAYGGATNTLVLRIAAGVDAYGIPDAWKVQYFGSANATNSGALVDADGDGMNNLAEYIAGTCPTNADSRFQCSGFSVQGGEFWLRFMTETGRLYGVVGRGEMTGTSQWVVVTNGLPGTGGYVEVRDPVTGAKKFYRIMVRLP